MHDIEFDRIARALSLLTSRRGLVAALGALVAMRRRPVQAASQLQPASCSAEGEVCTHLLDCCSGLVCGTSYINTNYGVCVPGEGDIAPVTSSLVTPGSEAMVTEVAAELAQLASAESVDQQAERAAALKARRDKRDTRLSTKRTKRKERRARQKAR
jgi:hypothetical protein